MFRYTKATFLRETVVWIAALITLTPFLKTLGVNVGINIQRRRSAE